MPDRGFRDDTQFHSTTNVNFGGGEEFSNSSNDTINADGQSKPSTSAVAVSSIYAYFILCISDLVLRHAIILF